MENWYSNSFRIKPPSSLSFSYKLFQIGNLPRALEDYDKTLGMLRTQVASDVRDSVVLTEHEDKDCLAVPLPATSVKKVYHCAPHCIELVDVGKEFVVSTGDKLASAMGLMQEFLTIAIKRTLNSKRLSLWSDTGKTFFEKIPSNHYEANRDIDVYRGFMFDVIIVGPGEFAITLDVLHKYVSKHSLRELTSNGHKLDPSPNKPIHCLYEMCQDWFAIDVTAILNTTVSQQRFTDKEGREHDVFSYTLAHALPQVRSEYEQKLRPDDRVVLYRYPYKKGLSLNAAASLARPRYRNEDEAVSQFHRRSILGPDARLRASQSYIARFFKGISIGDSRLEIDMSPMNVKPTIFAVPDIRYGNGHVIRIRRSNLDSGAPLENLGRERLNAALRYGVIDQATPLRETFLLVPSSLIPKTDILDGFRSEVSGLMKKMANQEARLKVVSFSTTDSRMLREQFDTMRSAISDQGLIAGSMLVVLPSNAHRHLHHQIKREYYKNFMIQCVAEEKLVSFYDMSLDPNGTQVFTLSSRSNWKFNSYVRNVAFGLLQVHQRWLSQLETPLHHDAHIGVDVLNGFVGVTFIYQGGRHCYFIAEPMPTSQKGFHEKVESKLIENTILTQMRSHLRDLKLPIRSVLLHRDGKSFTSENRALEKSIKKLIAEGLLTQEVRYGVVEIHKGSAAKVRLYSQPEGANTYFNPRIGASWYFGKDGNDAVICTTGYPFTKWENNKGGFEGTADPLHVRLVLGNLKILEVAQDIFSLSVLCWSSPDKSNRLHLPIKLADDFLEPIAARIDEREDFAESEEVTADQQVNLN